MKAEMLKISLLTLSQNRKQLTARLAQMGVFHLVEPEEMPSLEGSSKLKQVEQALQLLNKWSIEIGQANEVNAISTFEGESLVSEIIDLEASFQKNQAQLKKLEEQIEQWQLWGDLDLSKIEALAQRGLKMGLYETTEGQFESLQTEAISTAVVKKKNRKIWFAAFGTKEQLAQINLDETTLPAQNLETLQQLAKDLKLKLTELSSQKASLSTQGRALEAHQKQLEEQLDFKRALHAYEQNESKDIAYLKAWFPTNKRLEIEALLLKESLAFIIENPSKHDDVPVMLKNSRFSKLFEPITKIFQLPHYQEFDLTPFIAVFYPILFAYCLGDMGYGLVMVIGATVGLFTFLKDQKPIAILAILLGAFTAVMGLIKSGSLFGLALNVEANSYVLSYLSQFVIIPDDSNYFFNAFNVALLIGVFQIIVGIVIAISKTWYYQGFMPALSQFGKLMIVVSAILLFMADSLDLSFGWQITLKIALALGVIFVMLFHDLSLSLVKRLGSSILPLFFIFTGLLGDVLSYVRLFALGVTSSVLGLVVNQIAGDMLGEAWYSYLLVGLFLAFGHTLNFLLDSLGAFIHPLRLTFVEFYNNAQFEGGGTEYKPFKKSAKTS